MAAAGRRGARSEAEGAPVGRATLARGGTRAGQGLAGRGGHGSDMHRRHLHHQREAAAGRRRHARRDARRGGAAARHLNRLGSVIAGALLLTLAALAVGHQRLREGPVSLGPLTTVIADRLAAASDGLRFSIGQAVFALGEPGEVSGLRLGDVRVVDAEGLEIAAAPELSMRFHLWDLAFGLLAPTEIHAAGISAVIERDAQGRLRLPGAARPEEARAAATPAELAAQASVSQSDAASALVALLAGQGPGDGPLGRLRKVTAENVDVSYRDHFTGQNWRLIDAELSVERLEDRDVGRLAGRVAPPPRAVGALADPGGELEDWSNDAAGRADGPGHAAEDFAGPDLLALEAEGDGPAEARFAAEGERRHDDGEVSFRARLGGLPIAHLALAAGAPLSEAATFGDLRAGVRARARLSREGAPISFRGSVRVGPGTLAGVPDPFGRIERLDLRLEGDEGAPGQVRVRGLRLTGPAGALQAAGVLERWRSGEGMSLSLDLDRVEISPEAGFASAQTYDDGRLRAHFIPGAGRIELETIQLESEAVTLAAQGAAEWGPEGPELAVGFATGPMSLATLLAAWPVTAGPNARTWVAEHLSVPPDPAAAAAEDQPDDGAEAAAPAERGAETDREAPAGAEAARAVEASLARAASRAAAASRRTGGETGGETAGETGGGGASEAAAASAMPGITAARGRFWTAPGRPPELTLDFAFQGLRGEVLAGMPAITGAAGRGRVGLDRFDVALTRGETTPPGGRAIDLAGSSFSAPDLAAKIPHGIPVVRAEGRVSDVLAVLDQPPLELIRKFSMDLSSVTGEASTVARLSFPLIRGLRLDQLQVGARSTIRGASAPAPGGHGRVTADSLSLEVDATGLRLSGAARIDGTPARISWRERFAGGDAADPRRAVELRGALDAAMLEKFGIAGIEIGEAAAPLRLSLGAQGPNDPDRFTLTADLGPAALSLPIFQWSKPAGSPGGIEVSGRFADNGAIEVERMSGEAGDLSFAGAARIGPEGDLRRLKLDRLVLGDLLDVGVELRDLREGRIVASVEGAFIDLGELWRRAEEAGEGDDAGLLAAVNGADDEDEAPAPAGDPAGPGGASRDVDQSRAFALDVKLAQARLVDGIELTAVNGRATRGDGITRATLSGEVNGGQRADLRYRLGRRGGGGLTLDSADAGALIRDLGLSDEVSGGVLKVRGRLPPGSDALVGVAEADGIRVGGREALSGVLDRAARRGLLANPDPARPGVEGAPAVEGGYVFDTVRAPFRYEGRRIRLTDALATGPMLALKVSGDYDFGAGALDLDGVLTPAYAINGILNDLPLVGFLLGGEGEGLLAMNFSVGGNASDPEISINPFSILTPGILRDLFSGFESRGDAAPIPPSDRPEEPGR